VNVKNEFEEIAKQQQEVGVTVELYRLLRDNKKWWLIPVVVVLLGIGVLVLLSSTAAAPFIYTLF